MPQTIRSLAKRVKVQDKNKMLLNFLFILINGITSLPN